MNTAKYKLGKHESPCETAQNDIALAVYGELPDDANHRLERHLTECGQCRQEMEAVQGLRQAMSLYPMEEPSPNLLTRTRLRLEEALDAVPHSGWLTRIADRFFNLIARVQSAPAVASAMVIIGLGAGGFGGYRIGQKVSAAPQTAASHIITAPDLSAGAPQIAGIRGIEQEPGAENVKISYDRVVPETMTGSLDNPEVRKLLLVGAQSHLDGDVRASSVSLLAGECRDGHHCADGPIRNALMTSLRHDKDANVRLKVLDGLQPYVGQDTNVRNAVLNALMNDSDSRVRIKAVALLQPVESDSSVRQALHSVADTDENPYLRTVSRQVLSGLPEVQ